VIKRSSRKISNTRLTKIKLVILDVDGVMTDGRMIYGVSGVELKSFDVYDGFGIARAIEKGLQLAVISRGLSDISERRAKALGITEIHQRSFDKLKTAEGIMKSMGVDFSEVCFMGDDEYDLGLLQKAGISAAPCTAYPPVLAEVDYITRAAGGRGAVREVLDMILKSKRLI
jgi:3-deoxy-D-manno-octulosonate 8-phosphate phosphatase (KDO 8-P phosphatase)